MISQPFLEYSYLPRDKSRDLFVLLNDFPSNYPRFYEWLDKRIDQIENGQSSCEAVIWKSSLVGVLIDTPKGMYARKVCTLFVHPSFRRFGAGSILMRRAQARWHAESISDVHITVPDSKDRNLRPFLIGNGFRQLAIARSRYREGRDEFIYGARF